VKKKVKMDAIRITEVVKELMKLLQNMSASGEDDESKTEKRVELEVNAMKEEFGSWFIDDFEIFRAS